MTHAPTWAPRALALVAALAGCDRAPPATAPAAAPRGADVVVDGIRLGDRFGSTVMTRAPDQAPCDDDGIDGDTATRRG